MKKIVSLLLAGAIVLSSAFCVSAGELPECTATFAIDMIKHHENPRAPLNFTFTLPDNYDDGTVLAAFYADNKLTRLENLNTLPENTITYEVTFDEDDGLALTPDEIKLFTWQNGSIKPLAKTGNILEDTAIVEYANHNTTSLILNPLLGINTSKTGAIEALEVYLYKRITMEESEEIDSLALSLVEEMGKCAKIAEENKSTLLLTSESTKRLLGDNYNNLVNLCKEIMDNPSPKELLKDAWANAGLTPKGKDAILQYLNTFFDLGLHKFLS